MSGYEPAPYLVTDVAVTAVPAADVRCQPWTGPADHPYRSGGVCCGSVAILAGYGLAGSAAVDSVAAVASAAEAVSAADPEAVPAVEAVSAADPEAVPAVEVVSAADPEAVPAVEAVSAADPEAYSAVVLAVSAVAVAAAAFAAVTAAGAASAVFAAGVASVVPAAVACQPVWYLIDRSVPPACRTTGFRSCLTCGHQFHL